MEAEASAAHDLAMGVYQEAYEAAAEDEEKGEWLCKQADLESDRMHYAEADALLMQALKILPAGISRNSAIMSLANVAEWVGDAERAIALWEELAVKNSGISGFSKFVRGVVERIRSHGCNS